LKRKILFVLLVVGLAVMTQAQGLDRNNRRMPAPVAVTVSGSLIVAHGMPAIKSGDTTYFIGGINRLVGFIDGLKEGAQVTIEGAALSSPRESSFKFLRPSKLTMSGKTYDLSRPEGFNGFMGPWGQMPRHNNYMRNPGQQGPFEKRGSPRNL
jgi:hypothetical protein